MTDKKKTILEAVEKLTDTYRKEELFLGRDRERLPNKKEIINFIKDMRSIIFPGYFSVDSSASVFPEHYVAYRLNDLYDCLQEQIEIAFLYQGEEEQKAKEHTEQITEKQVTLDVDGEEGIYLKKCPVELLQLFTAKRDIYRIKEEIKIPGTKENIGTLLWTEVSSRKMDTRLVQDAMLINGELQIFVLYESQEGKTDWVEQTVPYEGRIECAGAEEGMYHHVYDRLDDISVEVRMDEDGEMRALGIEAALQVRLFVYGEEKLELLEDAYSLDKKCVLETEEVVVEELLMQNHSKSKITERLSLPELKDEILQVCHSSADLQIEKMEVQDGGILAEGILNVSFLYVKANDEVPFGVWKGMVPFSAMLECREGSSDMKYDVTYAVEQLAVDLAGNDEVEIKAVVAFRSFMRKAEKIQMVTEAALVDYEKEERMNQPGIVGYIVKDGDDLWSLAKKYSTTEESILLNNELLSKELKTGDKILIFRESLSIL